MQPNSPSPPGRLDLVTNLPNRQQFMSDHAVLPAASQVIMITLVDAFHFNQILRAMGHDHADEFIRLGAARIREIIPPAIVLYHISLLSFCFLYRDDPDQLVTGLISSFAAPLVNDGIPITTRLGIGLSAPSGNISAAGLLRTALAAAQDSRTAHAGWARYDGASDFAHQRGFVLLSEFPTALQAKDQLTLHFQPKYHLATGCVTSAEALVRWAHPKLGSVPPGEFIPLAETTAYIHNLTDWVLRHAAAECVRWRDRGWQIKMALNISPLNLSRIGFARHANEILSRHGADPAWFEFEVTEGALLGNNPIIMAELQALRGQGIHVALDDFGTGFSNFSYITDLPVDILKIDRSFILRISTDERAAAVVTALIQLSHRLGYQVVAEGIETASAYELLAAWGCDEGQGYYMSRPLDASAFARLMQGPPANSEIVKEERVSFVI